MCQVVVMSRGNVVVIMPGVSVSYQVLSS